MFEKEAEDNKPPYAYCSLNTNCELWKDGFQKGAEFGYNKGYYVAEEHYLNVIDCQHKLVDESRKKDFKKCMKCTDGTYQYGFKDGYNKAKEEMQKNGLALQSDMDKTIEQNMVLKVQIEKMKLCQNCKFEDCDYLEEPCSVCSRCLGDIKRKGNFDKWELQED